MLSALVFSLLPQAANLQVVHQDSGPDLVREDAGRTLQRAGGHHRLAQPDRSWYPHELAPPFVTALAREEGDTVRTLHAGSARFTIDDEPALPSALSLPLKRDGRFLPGYFIVHFDSELRPADKEMLDRETRPVRRADGSSLVRWYLPNNGLVAWVENMRTYRLLEGHPRVDFVGRYQPAYKLDPTIGTVDLPSPERQDRHFYRLNVDLMPGHDLEEVVSALEARGAFVLERVDLRHQRGYDVRFLVVDAAPDLVTLLAEIEGVRMIQEAGDGKREHDISGGGKLQARTLTVDNGPNSPIVNATTFPLWLTYDLQGQHQMIGVVDGSMDWNNVGTSGCNTGFPDTNIDNYGFALPELSTVLKVSVGLGGVNLKIPRSDELGGATLFSGISNDHGMAVAGAAVADFYGDDDTKWWEQDPDTWETWSPTNFSGLLGPAIAHEAQLYFTPLDDNSGNFRWENFGEFESNMDFTLTRMANAGCAASVHSTGLLESNDTYTQTSVVHDTEAFDHPDMLQCMAAGNEGAGSGRLNSQAVVKNALTVGASDDVLRPEDRASFSSTGPTFDGRRKPEILTPGTDTAPRAGGGSLLILPDSNGGSAASCAYQWTEGTSFSAPIAAGAVALIHQYFEEGRYLGSTPITDPSAALMTAMISNTSKRLTGSGLTGNYPDNNQGWGEPVLTRALDFGDSDQTLVAFDVDSASGFNSSGSPNDVYTFEVTGSVRKLRVTLAWTDEPGSAGVGKKLINDLDLEVTEPNGTTTYLGNVFSGNNSTTGGSADTLNNLEMVHVPTPATGTWTVTIDPGPGNYASGQGYALVITGEVAESGGTPPPVADFFGAPLSGEAPLSVDFFDLSTGSVSTHDWDFGDTGSSTSANPTHIYNSPGTYTVTLTVTGPGGSDSETKNDYVVVTPPAGSMGLWYVSFDSTVSLPIPVIGEARDEDVVVYDPALDTWDMVFLGADVVQRREDVGGVQVLNDGSLLLNFKRKNTVLTGLVGGPNGDTVRDQDIVRFIPTSTGSPTAGSWEFLFDGSDVNLTQTAEDIDGFHQMANGDIAMSILGNAQVAVVGQLKDEDILLFTPIQFGADTDGTWSLLFDGSDLGFNADNDHDINGLTFENDVELLFTTLGAYSAAGGSGNGPDISRFTGTLGDPTSGVASLELALSALGVDPAETVDAVHYVP